MRRRLGVSALGLAVVSAGAASVALAHGPIVLRDLAEHELRLEHTPKRVITRLPPLTEIVCALAWAPTMIKHAFQAGVPAEHGIEH